MNSSELIYERLSLMIFIRSKDEGMIIYLSLLGYSRTFDTLNGELLLAKLKHCGVPLRLLTSYFSGRRQTISLRLNKN